MGFQVDHVWVVAAAAGVLAEEFAAATGLPVLAGWSPGGVLRSRGVRFANGPFLDIHEAPGDGSPSPSPALLLSGRLAEAQTLAQRRAWRMKLSLGGDAPAETASPLSLGFFSRGQGLLSQVSLIDYEIDPAACRNPEYAAPLFALDSAPARGARLDAVWITADDPADANADLRALGFSPAGDACGGARRGLRFAHPVCDLVVCPGAGGVVRLDVSGSPSQGARTLGPFEVSLR